MSSAEAWAEALKGFASHLRTDVRTYLSDKPTKPRAATTRESYVRHVRWLSESASTGPWDVTAKELGAWLAGQNWSVSTTKKVLVSVREFYSWGVSQGFLEWAPTGGMQSAARQPGPRSRPWQPAWEQPVLEFVDALRSAGRTDSTAEAYLFRLRSLSEVAASPWGVTAGQLEQWLSNPDWSPSTRRNHRTAVCSFYKWATRRGYVQSPPTLDLPQVRVPRALPRPAPHDVVHAALVSTDDRTRLAVLLAVDAGLRRSEIANLHTAQVAPTHVFVTGKGGHQRVVPLDPDGDLAAALRVELERRRNGRHGTGWSGPFVKANGYLFPSPDHPGPITAQRMGNLISRALAGEWTAHPLRHRFATDAYAVERDLQAVQQLLGHSKPETTAVYAQVPDGAMLAAVRGISAQRRGRSPG